jgi:hypothetical protein
MTECRRTVRATIQASCAVVLGIACWPFAAGSAQLSVGTFAARPAEDFVRMEGPPHTSARTFIVADPTTTYTLRITNGGASGQYRKVSSGAITLNGMGVVSEHDFNQQSDTIMRPVTLQTTNDFTVRLASAPGSGMTVEFLGADNVPPSITASVDIASNGAGWNDTDLLISFTCSDQTSGIKTCPSPINATTEGQGQSFSGTGVDFAGNTAQAAVTLNIDKTAPAVTMTSPSHGAVVDTESVDLNGTAADSLSGMDVITCQGMAAVLSGPAFSCTVMLEVGPNVVTVLAKDLAGNTAQTQLTIERTSSPATDTIDVAAGSQELFIKVGESGNAIIAINLLKQAQGTFNVTAGTAVQPADGGLELSSDYPSGGYSTSSIGSLTFVLNQSFKANIVGTYTVVNTATIPFTNLTDADTIVVHVLPPGGDPKILPVSADPEGVQVGVQTDVTFTAMIAAFAAAPAQLDVVQLSTGNFVGILKDDGIGQDLEAADGVFTGTVPVIAAGEQPQQFVARGGFPGVAGTRESAPYTLSSVCFPVGMLPAGRHPALTDPATGDSFVSQEALVVFNIGTSCARQSQIVATVAGTIVGTSPGTGIYQVDVPSGTTVAALYTAFGQLRSQQDVLGAKGNLLGVMTSANPPNDPYFAGTPAPQYAPQRVRANEAWLIERGGPLIAIVDSGVNYNHEDLIGKVIVLPKSDFIGIDDDPNDTADHGTHVAGIAAASSNNGIGIVGMSWKSKILAVRGVGGTYQALADAIRFAANKGAKVINISGGGPNDVVEVKNAVAFAAAKGALVVSTPANLSQVSAGTLFYPGAYPQVFCVGSTTSADTRDSGSNYGAYVDIAAPGANIYSLLSNGGYGFKSGVSMAAPMVSGAAALVWSHFPAWTADQVKARLAKTAHPMPGQGLGAGRIDAFDAVFNGSFEDDTNGWQVTGTAGAQEKLGPIPPTHEKHFGFASSGPASAQVETALFQSFSIQPGVTDFVLKFDYNFVTEEYPEWVNEGYNDDMRIVLIKPDGSEVLLALESVDGSSFSLVGGIDFPGGDVTVGQTGWKSVNKSVAVVSGPGTFRLVVRDRGDGIFDSNVLIDNIRFE